VKSEEPPEDGLSVGGDDGGVAAIAFDDEFVDIAVSSASTARRAKSPMLVAASA
jgi:hypothetical protein